MMADLDGEPPERPGGKKNIVERDFRPDVDEEEEDEDDELYRQLPSSYQRINLRLHVHFSF